jgi:hypothetical protein
MTFDQIFDVVKMALNLGLVFLDIVASVKQIYQEMVAKFLANYADADAPATA